LETEKKEEQKDGGESGTWRKGRGEGKGLVDIISALRITLTRANH